MTKTDLTTAPENTPIEPSMDQRLRTFWGRYGNLIYLVCGLVALAILAKGGMDYLSNQKELTIQKDFAAATTSEQYKAFAADHPGHPLASLVDLRTADEAYIDGKYPDAVASYEKAVSALPAGPFQARARLGLAMAQAQAAGGRPEGETGLRQLLSDESELKSIRCEAGFHLAEIAVASGRTGEVQRLAEQMMQIDPSNPFSERAFQLRAAIPESAAPAAPSMPSIAIPASH
jgi:hypothetical protein